MRASKVVTAALGLARSSLGRAGLIVFALALACGGEPGARDAGGDAGGDTGSGSDGAAPDAEVTMPRDASLPSRDAAGCEPLEIGRCVLESGALCTGSETEATFAPLDGPITPVVGPQGATMFPLAIRTRGVSPGDPTRPFASENPELELLLFDVHGDQLATLRSRAGLRAIGDELEASSLYLIVDERPTALIGEDFVVMGHLVDAEERERCGEVVLLAR
jgi:hypothetical protein